MKKISVVSLSLFVLFALVLAACAPAAPAPEPMPVVEEEAMEEAMPEPEPTAMPEPEPMTIVDVAVADGRFTTLAAALGAADLVETLQGDGPFTVFAPTDDAFAMLPEGTVEALLADIPALTEILLYHVVSGEVVAADVVELFSAETVGGMPVKITVDGDKVMINGAQVIITDVMADNGVIHVIDSVLLPPGDIVDVAVADGRFTTLATALTEAGLVDTLKGEGPFTVFAPTDDAFAKLPEGTIEALLADIPALTDILLFHVAPESYMASEVVEMPVIQTAQGGSLIVQVMDGKVMINGAEVIITDVYAKNGVIHVIDSVLLPQDIVDTAVADGRFNTLATALTEAGLVDTLKGEGPFTVFAPTDDAFALLPEGTIEALLADIPTLSNILLYHVVAGDVRAADVVELESADTVLGAPVSIKVMDGKVYINDSQVIIADIVTSNGVIHVIDAVLLPPQS